MYRFLGSNGSGTTTTLRVLLGLVRASSGTARVLGDATATACRRVRHFTYERGRSMTDDPAARREITALSERDHGAERARLGMRRPKAWPLFIVAIVFSLVLTYPYLSLDIGDSRLVVRDSLQYFVLVAHIFTAAVALVLGPLQFIPKVRARRRIHRTLGRVYLFAGVLPSAVATIPVAVWSGRPLTQIGLTTAAVLWLITGGLAYRAARRRDFIRHRAWMMRNYALTFLAVTSRILIPMFLLIQIPFGGADLGSIGARASSMIPIGQTLGWIINLIVVERLIRRTPHTGSPRRNRIVLPKTR